MKTAEDQTTRTGLLRSGFGQAGLGCLAVAALMLTACAPDEEAEFQDGEQAAQTEDQAPEQTGDPEETEDEVSAEEEAEETDETDEDTEAEDSAAEGPIDPEDAVDTITYDIPSESIDGTMTVGLHHLRVEGETMELLLTYTPEFSGHQAYNLWELHARNHSLVAPSLFDRENLKRYDILRTCGLWDVSCVWATPQADVDLASGDTQAYWANFAVPEDEIETINIGIPNAPEFEDVEIDWDGAEPGDEDTGQDDAEDGE